MDLFCFKERRVEPVH